MKMPVLLATGAAALMIGSSAVLAQESIWPRTYTVEDCQELTSQFDESLRYSNIAPGQAAMLQARRDRAAAICFSGNYPAGARALRSTLDDLIASRSYY